MLKTKVKISQITNLTDARYFSAMGVDYLGFTIYPEDPYFISPPALKEITEWVEGPELVLETPVEVDSVWIANYQSAISNFYLESSVILLEPDFQIITNLIQNPWDEECFLIYKSEQSWKDNRETLLSLVAKYPNRLFLDIPFSPDETNDLLQLGFYGLILRGGEEEKVGFKSYDDLDEIFDFLME